jgi:UDP-N-acetylglucosamine acyltransferase
VIHATAIIDPSAKIAEDVEIGPYSIIGPQVEIGPGCNVGPHVVIEACTKIGANNRFYPFGSIGAETQDKKYRGGNTFLEIGSGNTFREAVTIHRGTNEGGVTRIGNNNLLMAYSHVAHDCTVGNECTFSNNATLAGHVHVADHVTLSGFAAVHQYCRLGSHAFVARASCVLKDVLPYLLVSGHDATVYGLNTVGLQRRGFSDHTLLQLRRGYKIIFRNNLSVQEAIQQLEGMVQDCPEIATWIQTMQDTERGFTR